MNKRRCITPLVAVCLGVLWAAAWAGAADFSADMVTKIGSTEIKGKIYRQGQMIRQDSTVGPVTNSVIIRPDKKVVWLINPASKSYSEVPYDPKVSDVSVLSNEEQLKKIAVKTKLGNEKVNGYDCEKFELKFKNQQQRKSTIWLAKKLQFPVKTVTQTPNGAITSECKNIKLGTPPKKLFDLPAGYKKVSMQELHGGQPRPAPKPGAGVPVPKPGK